MWESPQAKTVKVVTYWLSHTMVLKDEVPIMTLSSFFAGPDHMSFTIIHSYCLVIALMTNKMYSFMKLLLMFIMLIFKCCLVFALITLNMYSFMIWMNISYMIIFNLCCVITFITWILVPPNLTKLWLNVSWNLWALKIYDLLLWMSFSKWIARNVHVLVGCLFNRWNIGQPIKGLTGAQGHLFSPPLVEV